MHSDIEVLEQQLPPSERAWWRLARYAGWTLVAIYFVAALAVLGLRFLVLPNVHRYTDDIAAVASRALGEKVTIGEVRAEWVGLHPRLELTEVRVVDRQGREALRLPFIGLSVAWRSVVLGRPILRSLEVNGANLQVRRDAQQRIHVAGMEVKAAGADGAGLADTVLDMRELVIRDAAVAWEDEFRRAPPLILSNLQFVLENDGNRHRFAIAGDPPRDHASTLDVRGELVGRDLEQLDEWDGRVYAGFDFIDLAVWSAWIDLPLQVSGGRGALRLWATLRDWRAQEATADVRLADVSMRIAPDLPPLELKYVEGRIGARAVLEGFEFLNFGGKREVAYEAKGTELALETSSGVRFEPATFTARWEPAGAKSTVPQGTFTATSIDLEPLARIGAAVPLPADARETLAKIAPEGRLQDVRVSWTGDFESPRTYSARARFSGLGMQPWGHAPGFARLAGALEVNEKGGSLAVDATDVTIDYPAVFFTGRHQFDALSAKIAWTRTPDRFGLRIDNLVASNADVAAAINAEFHTVPDSPGWIDLTAKVARADGSAAWRYIPRVAPATESWLRRGLVAAQGSDGRVRLKGDLRDYPFDDARTGTFEVSVKAVNGIVEVGENWPRITNVQGEFAMSGRKLQVRNGRGTAGGAQLSRVTVTIPDTIGDSRLLVDGNADAATSDVLRYITTTPLNRFTDRAFEGWTASGAGKLVMALDLPLDDSDTGRLSGTYQMLDNTVTPGVAEAALSQVNGRIEFTETSATARGITAQWQGGPIGFDVVTRNGATQVNGQATVNVSSALEQIGMPFASQVSGTAPIRFNFNSRSGQATHVIESPLQEVAIDLPPPFNKAAGEPWPLRVERTTSSGGQELVEFSLAKVASGRVQLRSEGGRMNVERAGIGVGDVGVALPDRPGVFVSVNVKTLDVDRFLALRTAEAREGPAFQIGALAIRTQELVVGGKLFHDVQARGIQSPPSRWQINVNAREVAGDVQYAADGKGAVVAKLKHLVHPDSAPSGQDVRGGETLEQLPAMEITAESYTFHERELGRLEVRAVNERSGWKVEQLALTSPDCTFNANGLWQPGGAGTPPRTSFSYDIEAAEAGKCLARLGHPDQLSGGRARLTGEAEWRGPVYAIDYPTLAGKLSLEADNGQFLRVKPGIGKLLGVLSLQSLPRRISLDFRDVFSEGFAFDRIRGTATIRAGVLRTDDFTMAGPAANVQLKGEADLARETQDLTVRVVPVVGDSVAAAAGVALLNPIIGAGALIAQRLLRDPIGQMFAFEYHVTGGWDDPKVERLASRAAAETEGPK